MRHCLHILSGIFLFLGTQPSEGLARILYSMNMSQGRVARSSSGEIYKAAEHLSLMTKCSHRLWPDYNWLDFQVIFVDPSKGLAVLWNDKSAGNSRGDPAISFVPTSSFSQVRSGSFKHITYKGVKTLVKVRRRGENFRSLTHFAIYHLFRETGQATMPHIEMRGDFYPVNWHARYLRRELIDSLRRAIKKREKKDLAEAAFWKMKLAELHPDEVKRNRAADLREGTAEYMSRLGTALAILGCDSSDEKVFRRAANLLDERFRPNEFDQRYEPDAIGLMAGLLLQMEQVDVWQHRAMKGEDMLDILLANVQPRDQKYRRVLATRFKSFYEMENAERGRRVKRFVEKMTSDNYFVLAVPDSWRVGPSTTLGPTIIFDYAGNLTRMGVGRTSRFEKPKGHASVEIHQQDVGFWKIDGEQKETYFYFSVAKKDLRKELDGSYSVRNRHVVVESLVVKRLRIEGSTTWLIAQ